MQPSCKTTTKTTHPSVGTLSRGSLPRSDLQLLGRHPHRTTHIQLLIQSTLLQISTHLLEVLDVTRGEGDTDAVDLGTGVGFEAGFLFSWGDVRGHFCKMDGL